MIGDQALSGTLQDPRENKHYYFEETPLRRGLMAGMVVLWKLFSNLEISGQYNLPSSGPVVLAANHLTNYDVFAMQLSINRPIFFMGKSELFQNPLLELLLRNLGGFPVYRGKRDVWAMQHAEQVLEHGEVLGIFPEGTRSQDGALQVGKTGAARLALVAGCPVTPLAVTGTRQLFSHFPQRVRVTVTIGMPILPEANETPLGLTDRIMFGLAEMLPENMRGVYASHPKGF